MRRTLWIGAAAVAIGIALLVGLANWTLEPASLKPRLIEAAERATGRTLTISGPVGIKLSLTPTITMQDVALSNPPNFSRPDIVKVERVELGLALLPLLRHRFEVDHVTLIRPDTLLETDQAGRSNWVFARTPAKPPETVPLSGEAPNTDATTRPTPDRNPSEVVPPSPEAAGRRFTPVLRNLTIVDGKVGWIDPSGHQYLAGIERLSLTEPAGPLADIDATISYEGRVIRLTARTGALEDLRSAFAGAPWPVSVKLVSDRTSLTVDGKIDQPLRGRGYAFAVNADVPDPASLESLLPRLPLGALGEISAHAEVTDSGGPVPNVSALRVTVASANVENPRAGARLEDIVVTADSGTPLHVAARMTMDGLDSAISGTVGDLAWLIGGRSAPVAVDLTWTGASARATVQGTIQVPRQLSGYDLNVAADIPEPALVLKDAPPGLASVMLRSRLTDTPEPMPFVLTSNAGDLQGALSVTHQPRWSVRGQIVSQHLDLDVLRGATRREAAPAVSPAAGAAGPMSNAPPAASGPRTSETPSVAGGSTGAPVGGPVTASDQGPLIPDTKLPFPLLREVDGDVGFAFTHVQLDGTDVRRISGTVSTKDGRLRVDPFNIAAPDQRMSGVLEADGASTPPMVHVSVDAPGLALRPLLAALGLPEVATGFAAVRADLTGAGDTPRAIAGSLNGWAEVAVEGGQLDARMLNAWLGPLQPLHMTGPDVTDLRCFAMRADAKSGVLSIDPMALNTPVLIVEGGGDVDLRTETMSLRLRPRGKIGATGIAVPVRLTGPWRDPSARVDISSKGFGGGALAGLLLGGKDIMGAAGGGDPCPEALARARVSGPEAPSASKP
jgi:hypothetical protein